jgi:hypothetical protein
MQLTAALREREADDRDRVERAIKNPNRASFEDPLDSRLECPLGRLRVRGEIPEHEFQAGVKWRGVYSAYLHSIQSPDEVSDEDCAAAVAAHQRGLRILEAKGKRVHHAVNSIAVFEDPEELGDFRRRGRSKQSGASLSSQLDIQTAEVFLPLLSPARYKGAHGGRGSGKSHFFAELVVEEHLRIPGTSAVCIREVLKSLKQSAKLLIEDKITNPRGSGSNSTFRTTRSKRLAAGLSSSRECRTTRRSRSSRWRVLTAAGLRKPRR